MDQWLPLGRDLKALASFRRLPVPFKQSPVHGSYCP